MVISIKPNRFDAINFQDIESDNCFEEALQITAKNHLERALRDFLGDQILNLKFTSLGHSVWWPNWLEANKRNASTICKQSYVIISGLRPVIDLPKTLNTIFDLEQCIADEKSDYLAKVGRKNICHPMSTKIKTMKNWNRVTVSFFDVILPANIFPWYSMSQETCKCPNNALVFQENIIPFFTVVSVENNIGVHA